MSDTVDEFNIAFGKQRPDDMLYDMLDGGCASPYAWTLPLGLKWLPKKMSVPNCGTFRSALQNGSMPRNQGQRGVVKDRERLPQRTVP